MYPLNLGLFTLRIRWRQVVFSFKPTDLLGAFKSFSQQIHQGGIDIVNAGANGKQLLKNCRISGPRQGRRSEEHTSELQSRFDLVCRLLLEKKTLQAVARRSCALDMA